MCSKLPPCEIEPQQWWSFLQVGPWIRMQEGMVGLLAVSASMQRLAMLDEVTRFEAVHAEVVALHGGHPLILRQGLEFGARVKGVLVAIAQDARIRAITGHESVDCFARC